MATLNTNTVVACMFQDDVTLTIGGETYALPANLVIGIPNTTTSLTVDIVTKAACMTVPSEGIKASGAYRALDIQALTVNEIRATV